MAFLINDTAATKIDVLTVGGALPVRCDLKIDLEVTMNPREADKHCVESFFCLIRRPPRFSLLTFTSLCRSESIFKLIFK